MNKQALTFSPFKKFFSSSSTSKGIQPKLHRINVWINTAIVQFLKTAEINYIVTNDKVGVFQKGKKKNLAFNQSKAISELSSDGSREMK